MNNQYRHDRQFLDITDSLADVAGGFAIDLDGILRTGIAGASLGAGRAFLTGGNVLDGAWKGAIYGGFAGLAQQAVAAPAASAAPVSFATPPTGTGTVGVGPSFEF